MIRNQSIYLVKMADLGLQERVIKLLSCKPKKRETLAKIVQTLRVPKKSLNIQLYKLKRQGRISKVHESPPAWALQEGAPSTALAPRTTRSRRKADNSDQKLKINEELEKMILEFLSGRQKPSKSLEIAKATGHARASDVNNTLYSMQERGLIKKHSGKTPTWVVVAGNARVERVHAIEGTAAIRTELYGDNSATDRFPTTSSGIPVFQDTQLFKTEVNYETEFDPSKAFTKVDGGNESEGDDESDDNEMTSQVVKGQADHDNQFYFDPTTGMLRGESPVLAASGYNSDISTQGTHKLFERSAASYMSGESCNTHTVPGNYSVELCGGNSTENENEAEETMEICSSSLNIVKCKSEPHGTIKENPNNYEEMRNVSCEMNTENKIPEFDREQTKKPKTFRDAFRLNDPMSDDTSSSFDSAKDIDAELEVEGANNDSQNVKDFAKFCSGSDNSLESKSRKSTPEISIVKEEEKLTPEQNIVQREWDTPQLLDAVLDLQEDVDTGSVNDMDGSGQFGASGAVAFMQGLDESERDMVKKMKELENTSSGSLVCPTHDLEAKDEISQVEMEDDALRKPIIDNEYLTDINESRVNLSGHDIEDCDKVLKVLLELKGIAQFVLKRKTDIPPDHLDEVLQKCLSLNYVIGSAKLWKITDEGVDYISKKTGTCISNSVSENEKFMQPEKKVKPAFKGPPPSPMALLGKKQLGSSGNGALVERINKQNIRGQSSTFTSHSPDSLFKPPSSSSSNFLNLGVIGSQSVSESVVMSKGSSGPKPLMSIQFNSNSLNKTKFAVPQSTASINQSQVGQGTVKPLMSIQFDHSPMDKASVFPHHSSNQMEIDQDWTNNSTNVTNDQKSGESPARTKGYSQNQQILNSNLWDTEANTDRSNGFNIIAKSQVSNSSNSSSQLFTSSGQTGSQKQLPGLQNLVKQGQRLTSPLNSRNTTPLQETLQREIPSKYADYPNQSTSLQCLNSKAQSQYKSVKQSAPVCPSESAFNKGPPPSPLDIISKGLKKTEISPPGSLKDNISVSHPSGSFSTMSLTNRNTGSSSMAPENKTLFSVGQFSLTGSNNYSSSSAGSKMEQTVTQSSFMQSGSLFGNQSKQSGFQSFFSSGATPNQSGSSFGISTARPVTGGPPPPPAVKLGLQVAESMPAPVTIQKQAQASSKLNLGLALNTESFNALNKNPVSALMEYAQSRKLIAKVEVLSRRGSSHKPTFELAAFVGDRKFPSVNCQNKKDGRKEACDIALRQLVAEGQFKAEASSTGGVSSVPSANMTHFDTIAALTHRGFTALVSQITAESFAGRKVIAGLVMKRSADDTGVLVSLGTGNRCITGPQLSLQGNTVNDSHAEIITRRGFLRFLYKQLLDFNPSRPHPMFERSSSGRFKIRPNITFHLYISTAPCGDGALFSPRDAESSKAPVDTRIRPPHEPIFSGNVQGLLRTKVEGGEGTIPIEPGFKGQTFDGIQRGERLRTMSCTDKVCRWNVVGMQGALLSHFLEPVYLDSLTLGLLYDHGHLSRAVCCRVGRGSVDVNTELPPGYRLNHPWLGRVTVCDPPREVQKTKALSVNWCFGDSGPEVTDGTLGLCYTSVEKGFFSRCSKRNLFTGFKALCEKFGRQDLLEVSTYNEAKVAAQDFVNAKQVMLKRFKENGFGKWVSKPVEEKMFGFDEQK